MRKAQIALEFIFMLLLLILLTTVIASAAYYYIADYSEARNIKRFEQLGYSLQNEVILAYNVEPGYVRRVNVPLELEGYPVNISGSDNDIMIVYKGNDLLFRIPTVNGQFTSGTNTIRKLADGSVEIN